ncbi:Histone-lysine N-methyltransferase SUV39H1 [Bienertia sinuspersici]
MAQYRQQSGLYNHLDYVSTSNSNTNNHHYSNGITAVGGSDHVSIGVRGLQHKQPRHHRRLGHSKRRISIGTIISLLCFVLAASAFAYVFLSRDHSPDIDTKDTQDDSFRDDFLANVTRIVTTPQLKFGHGSMAHGLDSRYWDGDDRRRDEDYNEDVHKSSTDTDDEAGEGHGSRGVKIRAKGSKGQINKIDHHGLYNEAGRNELKMYEEKYEASLKNVGQAGVETEDGTHVSDEGNLDMESEDVDVDDEYDDGIDSHDAHVEDYDDNGHEIETKTKLLSSHSEDFGSDFGKSHDMLADYDSSKDSSTKLQSGKSKQTGVADTRSNTNSGKQPKKRRKHRKFSSSSCDMKLLNSTAQLVEPLESRKFARFSLSYAEREEKPEGVGYWEPRFAGHQSLREREDSFLARDQKINCGFVKGPKEYSSTGFDLAEDDYRYISKCHIAVVSCIFGNSDRLRSPFVKVISRLSRKNVCFVMFMDEKTLQTITSEGQIPDRMGFIGLWKVVVVKNLPYTDMRRVGKIPKLLSHRLFPSARYSIWLDSKLRLQRDPLLLLEHFLWRKGHEYSISNHYDRHCVWEEVERNKKLNKFNHTMIDQQFQFYQADGLKRFNASDPGKLLPSSICTRRVPDNKGTHTNVKSVSCLWFNEVDRFTPRDQLSFAYTYQKLKKKNPGKTFYLHMFKDCERRQIAKLFHHRSEEKRSSTQDVTE